MRPRRAVGRTSARTRESIVSAPARRRPFDWRFRRRGHLHSHPVQAPGQSPRLGALRDIKVRAADLPRLDTPKTKRAATRGRVRQVDESTRNPATSRGPALLLLLRHADARLGKRQPLRLTRPARGRACCPLTPIIAQITPPNKKAPEITCASAERRRPTLTTRRGTPAGQGTSDRPRRSPRIRCNPPRVRRH